MPTPLRGRLAEAVLVAANLVPLTGVLFRGWDAATVLVLFWLENGVIGVFNGLRMAAAAACGGWRHLAGGLFQIAFFSAHYGIFWVAHGGILLALLQVPGAEHANLAGVAGTVRAAVTGAGDAGFLRWPLLALVLSHGVSFVTGYLGRGEHRHADIQKLMARAYGRVVLLHVVLLGGGFVTQKLGSPTLLVAALVVAKIVLDLRAHRRANRVSPVEH